MRGEDTFATDGCGMVPGSPPHARGRHLLPHPQVRLSGITPACAGKTSPLPPRASSSWDHPRMRGEDDRRHTSPCPLTLSPPHARGRRDFLPLLLGNPRITPACAGKTIRNSIGGVFGDGSPPHARGRRTDAESAEEGVRITPACAGKTSSPVRTC